VLLCRRLNGVYTKTGELLCWVETLKDSPKQAKLVGEKVLVPGQPKTHGRVILENFNLNEMVIFNVFSGPVLADESLTWRYMNFVSFVSLLQTRQLFFSSPGGFVDPFEGVMAPTIAALYTETEPQRQQIGLDEALETSDGTASAAREARSVDNPLFHWTQKVRHPWRTVCRIQTNRGAYTDLRRPIRIRLPRPKPNKASVAGSGTSDLA
jgi:hypothetical protein